MTNKEILTAAMWQSAIDINCAPEDFQKSEHVIVKREKVPFYCCAWSNIPSARNAVKSGFVPSWVELTVKPAELVDSMNR